MTTANTVDALTLRHFTLSLDKQRLAWLRIDMATARSTALAQKSCKNWGRCLTTWRHTRQPAVSIRAKTRLYRRGRY